MKKIIIITTAFLLALALFSCNATPEDNQSTASKEPTSQVSKNDDLSGTESEGTASQAETSEDETEQLPAFITNYVSFAPLAVGLRATDATSIRLTKINESAAYGDIVLYTRSFGSKIHVAESNYDDYTVMVCEYNHTYFGYVKTAVYGVDDTSSDKSSIEIPRDGFVIVAHKAQSGMIGRFNKFDSVTTLYVNGIQVADVGFTISETKNKITIDGVVDNEWKNHKIDHIDQNNKLWKYSSFEKDNYYATADYYMTFDKDYLYIAVVVNSPHHHCPIIQSNASSMWQYECIQVKVVDQSPLSDFMLGHYDHSIDQTAVNQGHVRSYGFAVNNEGETCYYESGINKTFEGLVKVIRDNAAQTTTYEAAITWEEFGIDITEMEQIGVTFSINSTNEEDIVSKNWRNLILREGGGVIGRNDWSKIPVVTLKHDK